MLASRSRARRSSCVIHGQSMFVGSCAPPLSSVVLESRSSACRSCPLSHGSKMLGCVTAAAASSRSFAFGRCGARAASGWRRGRLRRQGKHEARRGGSSSSDAAHDADAAAESWAAACPLGACDRGQGLAAAEAAAGTAAGAATTVSFKLARLLSPPSPSIASSSPSQARRSAPHTGMLGGSRLGTCRIRGPPNGPRERFADVCIRAPRRAARLALTAGGS